MDIRVQQWTFFFPGKVTCLRNKTVGRTGRYDSENIPRIFFYGGESWTDWIILSRSRSKRADLYRRLFRL